MSDTQKLANRQVEDCPNIELNGQSLEIVETFCYIGDTMGATGGPADTDVTGIRSGWSKSRDLKYLLASWYVHSVMSYKSKTWPVKEEDVTKLERNDARMVR